MHRILKLGLELEQTKRLCIVQCSNEVTITHLLNHFTALFWDHPGKPMPEEKFWTKGRLTEADTPNIRLGATLSGLTSAYLHHPSFLQAGCPSCRPTNRVKALKATSAFGLRRKH